MSPVKKLKDLPSELADKLDMPEDILSSAAKLTVTAGRRLLLENHRGVLDYSPQYILINLGRGKLEISGANLSIKAMNRTELIIAGRIQTVEWE